MHRKRLVATVAAAPLLVFAQGAFAETTITTAVTTPVQTSTTNDDVRVTSTGSIKPTVAGPALLMNSDDNITNEGAISTNNVNGSIGMQAEGGRIGNVLNKGSISIIEDYTATDAEDTDGTGPITGDGDLDGPFAQGTGRYGIRVTEGTGPLVGSVTNDTGATITVEGNASYGIRVESGLAKSGGAGGNLMHRGTISVVGGSPIATTVDERSYGIRTEGHIEGAIDVRGAVSVLGKGSIGVSIEDEVDGVFRVQGAVSSRGYRSATASTSQEAFNKLDADDLLEGGSAVSVTGNIDGGILVDTARPADASTTDTDEDDDGIPDAEEGASAGSITSIGPAPALQIGGAAQAVTIGAVGTGDAAYGLVNKGAITGSGVHQDRSATGIQLGSDSATTATLVGGLRNEGGVSASAVDDSATAIRLTNGARIGVAGAGALVNAKGGTISAQTASVSGPSTGANAEEGNDAIGVLVEAGAIAGTLTNGGNITAVGVGEHNSAIGVEDRSGTLLSITNTGAIRVAVQPTDPADGPTDNATAGTDTDDEDEDASNETPRAGRGEAIAIDVSASTAGVTITQSGVDDGDDGDDDIDDLDTDEDGVDNADEPLIEGDIRMGSGADTLNLANGIIVGDLSFGAGADVFNITGGGIFSGNIEDDDDLLSINVTDGRLSVTEITTIDATSLNVGADGVLVVAIDPNENTSTLFQVDTANFATGSQIGVLVEGLLTFENLNDTQDFLIVDAGTLTAGEIDDTLLGASPYIYNVGVNADVAAGEVSLSVRRRTAIEAGLNASQTAAFDAFYLALAEDEDVRDEFLARFTREDFLTIYNQMLPDQGEGLFSALDYANVSMSRATATKPDLRQRYGPDSFWVQELNVQVKRDQGETLGSEAKGFGFVGGYEAMDDAGGALGATLAYINAEENDDAAQVGEQTTVSLFEAGVYWRRAAGSWLFSVRGGAGYAFFDGTRRFVTPATSQNDPAVVREATAEWNGYTLGGGASVAYEARFGRYYARPTLAVDYFYLSEGEREESGWENLNQTVEERSSSRLSGTAEVAFGAEFGRDFWWRPEVKVGFRQVLAGEVGDTVARFGTGDPFTLSAMESGDGAAIVGLALRAGTAMSYLALEAEMERVKNEQRYNAKLTGRVMF